MAQVPPALSRGLRGVCEILDGVVRALGAEVARRKEPGFGLRWVNGLCISPSASCRQHGCQQRGRGKSSMSRHAVWTP